MVRNVWKTDPLSLIAEVQGARSEARRKERQQALNGRPTAAPRGANARRRAIHAAADPLRLLGRCLGVLVLLLLPAAGGYLCYLDG